MAGFTQNIQPDYCIRLDSSLAKLETDCGWLLDAVRVETRSETAVLYEVSRKISDVSAVVVRSSIAARVKDVGVKLGSATNEWIHALTGPAQSMAAGEPNFGKFPEVVQFGLKRLLIAPLRTEDRSFGLLTLGRSVESEFDPSAIEVAHRTARLLTAVLEHDFLQEELLERKLVERARGILQERRRLSEQQAYLALRNDSRRRGISMVDVAKEIIDTYVQEGGRFHREVWRRTI